MMARQHELELPPRASALVESLRDMGYSLRTALADVVDNSITAGATTIQLLADTHAESPAIGVLDNGVGMSREDLLEAMRPGTRSPLEVRDEADLGRFGLGLKTASFSQCRRLTVVTQKDCKVSCAIWDLDRVAARDRWVVEVPDSAQGVQWSHELGASGTLVVWEKLDRLVGPDGRGDRRDLVRQLDDAASHLEFVFHRFLSGREGGRVAISLNGRALKPFDPFHSTHTATQHHPVDEIGLGGRTIRVRPVTLPHHDKVTAAEWKRYAGPEGYVSNQGFYLYRNRRLIVHGTWFRLTPKVELTKLARVGIDIPNTMDAEWKIDVRKASAQPPAPVRKHLATVVGRMGGASRRTYNVRGTKQATDNRLPIWARLQNKNRISYDICHEHPFLQAFKDGLQPDSARDFERLLRLVASALPIQSLHHDVSANPEAVSSAALVRRDLRPLVSAMLDILQNRGLSPSEIRDWMRSAETVPNAVVGNRQDNRRYGASGVAMTDLQKLNSLAHTLLAQGRRLPTQASIRGAIAEIRPLCPGVTDDQAERLALELETLYDITIRPADALYVPFQPWLDAQRSKIDPYYRNRYRQLLTDSGFPRQVLAEIDNDTDRIVGFLENPEKPGEWDRRGMVVGHVQSGKTANYIGVVTKAADAGYRVIIVIAGIQNKLRDQTQRRVDEGFIGFDTAAGIGSYGREPLGVGRYGLKRKPITFTTAIKDFSKDVAESLNIRLQDLREPVVFVIKKNTHTLRNLIDWLTIHNARLGTAKIREPMLLIDDEADNASINIHQRLDKVSTINGHLRSLLNLFERSCYVGYTATPFANIFIDPDDEHEMVGHDLFPRDFIVCLNPPSNYFGAKQVFRDDTDTILQSMEDYEDLLPLSHSKNHLVANLPDSLHEAVRVFVVARSLRMARGQECAHNSMLVNVSRFIAVQRQVRNEIHALVEQMAASIRINGARPFGEAVRDPEIAALHRVFAEHYQNTCGKGWADVQALLHDSVSAIRVVAINSESTESLNYADYADTGLNVIAVGGMSLSRGLTLEGLTVSYFLRRSLMYDTLFQMGRWFGYRDGYGDLCRVWMPEEAQGWYQHIAESNDELRDELARMQRVAATPREFGLKVRSHPDSLVVTARNKMGSGMKHKVMIGLANRFVETAILHRDDVTIATNIQAVVRLAEDMRAGGRDPARGERVSGGRLVRDVPVGLVDAFLGAFKNHPGSPATESEPVRRYIANRADELSEWDVLFAGVRRAMADSIICDLVGFRLVCQRRAPGDPKDRATLMVTKKQRVASRGVERVGLTDAEARMAEKRYRFSEPRTKNYPDWIYRRVRRKPLLLIHLLAIGMEGADQAKEGPVAAWSISFPHTDQIEERVEYVVNKTWIQGRLGDDDRDEDDEE